MEPFLFTCVRSAGSIIYIEGRNTEDMKSRTFVPILHTSTILQKQLQWKKYSND